MRFVWDENKRLANLKKHGIDFIDCELAFGGRTVTMEDAGGHYGEQRFVTLGVIDERVVVVVHTEADDVIRVISIRKATKREQALYFESIQD